MSATGRFITCAYRALLRLYPRSFRAEFEEEMCAVFAIALAEAAEYNKMAPMGAFWRELRDCPKNLFIAHWQSTRKWTKETMMVTGNNRVPGCLPAKEGITRGFAARLSKHTMVKRLFDIAIAGLFLTVSAPLCAVLAVLIKLDSPGPVIFCQQRVGKNGRPFTMYKFRSMVYDADRMNVPAPGKRDPRLTHVGQLIRRLYLDELPQLFNILKGEMSVFGPRPELPQ